MNRDFKPTTKGARLGRAWSRRADAPPHAVSKGCKGARHMKKDTALDPSRRRQHFQMLAVELKEKGKEAMATLPWIDRRRRDPAGPPAPAQPDHPGELVVIKFCALTERTQLPGSRISSWFLPRSESLTRVARALAARSSGFPREKYSEPNVAARNSVFDYGARTRSGRVLQLDVLPADAADFI